MSDTPWDIELLRDDQTVVFGGQAVGTPSGGSPPLVFDRDPDSGTDTGYPVGQTWFNSDTSAEWRYIATEDGNVWTLAIVKEIEGGSGELIGIRPGAEVNFYEADFNVHDADRQYLAQCAKDPAQPRRFWVSRRDNGEAIEAWGIAKSGAEVLHATPPIDDDDVQTSERQQQYDDTAGAPKLRIKQRDSAGTLTERIAAVLTSDATAFAGVDKPTIGTADAASIISALVTLGLVIDGT